LILILDEDEDLFGGDISGLKSMARNSLAKRGTDATHGGVDNFKTLRVNEKLTPDTLMPPILNSLL
jgi:hypothetical protein